MRVFFERAIYLYKILEYIIMQNEVDYSLIVIVSFKQLRQAELSRLNRVSRYLLSPQGA